MSDDDAQPSLIEFPTDYSVKVMGVNDAAFEPRVRAIVEPHVDPADLRGVDTLESRQGKYVSVRLHFVARTSAQLEAIYLALAADELVLFTL